MNEFTRVSREHAGTPAADLSLMALGILKREDGANSEAMEIFRGVGSKRTDDLGAEAQFRIGETLFLQANYKEAVTQLLRVRYVYPSATDWIARGYLKLGECYEHLEEKGKAREAYQTVLNTHKENEFGKEAGRKIKGMK